MVRIGLSKVEFLQINQKILRVDIQHITANFRTTQMLSYINVKFIFSTFTTRIFFEKQRLRQTYPNNILMYQFSPQRFIADLKAFCFEFHSPIKFEADLM